MNKNLPNVYAVPIEKKITNNNETYISSLNENREGSIIPTEEIDKIFNAREHVYKTKVKIKTKNGEEEIELIGKTNDSLLTLDGKKIKIEDILEIKKV